MKKNTSWKFTDELSVTFQSSVSGVGEFGLNINTFSFKYFWHIRVIAFPKRCLYWITELIIAMFITLWMDPDLHKTQVIQKAQMTLGVRNILLPIVTFIRHCNIKYTTYLFEINTDHLVFLKNNFVRIFISKYAIIIQDIVFTIFLHLIVQIECLLLLPFLFKC